MTFDLKFAEKTVNHWVKESGRIATEHGFGEQSPAESIALMHSELSEALEDLRNGRRPNEVYFEEPVDVLGTICDILFGARGPETPPGAFTSTLGGKICDALGNPKIVKVVREFLRAPINTMDTRRGTQFNKPCGVPIELADTVIRIMHFCDKHNINLSEAIAMKMAYNDGRPHRHGKAF